MLVLSVLIVLALATAVASILVTGTPWLLVIAGILLFAAFYFSRRSTRLLVHLAELQSASAPIDYPLPQRLHVSVDHRILVTIGGRHRDHLGTETDPSPVRTEGAPTAADVRAPVVDIRTRVAGPEFG